MFDNTKLRKRRNDSHQPSNTVLPHHRAPPHPHKRIYKFRRHKRTMIWSIAKSCLGGMAATLVSGSLSLLLLPSDWLQVDYKHQMQHAASRAVGNIRKKGSNPSYAVKQPTPIICNDGSRGWLNDGYCDCLDGMDEPLTPACSFRLVQERIFHCKDGSGSIYSSRIRDGVHDCKDGSDEK